MSYTPTGWKSGDTITSAKLNKIEQGIANNNGIWKILLEHDDNDIILGDGNITCAMIDEALTNDKNIILVENELISENNYSVLMNTYYHIDALFTIKDLNDNVCGYTIKFANSANYSYRFGAPDMNTPLEFDWIPDFIASDIDPNDPITK